MELRGGNFSQIAKNKLEGAPPLPAVGKGGDFDFPKCAVHPAARQNQRQKPHPNVERHDVRMGHPRPCFSLLAV